MSEISQLTALFIMSILFRRYRKVDTLRCVIIQISGVTMRLLLITAVLLVPVINAAEKVTWDVLIFTQQWPITSCISHMEHDPGASCNLFPNMTSWTVHGIWPTTLGTIGPNFCNKSWHFQEKEIIAIEPYLIKYWGNIYAEDSRTSLWKHEWLKHGTCAAQLPQLNTQKKYFEKAMKISFLEESKGFSQQ
ncbi:hypothetical protein O3P69_010980 [Scylla paramamosain]|uniref:Uncharacterized protein n=1 Tax=Scylla paramamosain TaxID=85552 RepID=A0AAW0SI29_SCYPA